MAKPAFVPLSGGGCRAEFVGTREVTQALAGEGKMAPTTTHYRLTKHGDLLHLEYWGDDDKGHYNLYLGRKHE